MIWLKSLIFLFPVVNAVSAGKPDEYLLFAMEDNDGLTSFYKTDFNLENKEKLVTLPRFDEPLDKLYFGSNSKGEALYWSYKGSDVVGRFEFSQNNFANISITEARNGVFAGPGSNDDLYIFVSDSKKIIVRNFDNEGTKNEMTGMTDAKGDVHFMSRNPCDEELAYFVECSDKNTGVAFDLKQDKILRRYDLNPSICFDGWSLMPDANRVFAVKGSEVYRTVGPPFEKYYDNNGNNIVNFAAGIEQFFYTTGDDRKIFKLTGEGGEKTEYEVGGKVAALLVHQHVPDTACYTKIMKNKHGEEFNKKDS